MTHHLHVVYASGQAYASIGSHPDAPLGHALTFTLTGTSNIPPLPPSPMSEDAFAEWQESVLLSGWAIEGSFTPAE